MPDFLNARTESGHWIPAFAGMTDVKPTICDSPVLAVLDWIDNLLTVADLYSGVSTCFFRNLCQRVVR